MTVNFSSGDSANMYTNAFSTPMANDYFGSQIFGSNPFGFQQQNQVCFTQAPNDLASFIIQQHASTNNASSALTMQDYVYATQVANMFAGQNAAMTPYTSFTQNDILAQQAMPLLFNNGQYIA